MSSWRCTATQRFRNGSWESTRPLTSSLRDIFDTFRLILGLDDQVGRTLRMVPSLRYFCKSAAADQRALMYCSPDRQRWRDLTQV
jgi:hypothetical protein